jgi:SAM-dependent methyltransferase
MPPNWASSDERATPRFLEDVVGWDVRTWSKAIAFWESADHARAPLDCLEIGARAGGLSLWLASKGHRVVCSDLRGSERARVLIERYGLLDRVTFEDLDATSLPYESRFDRIVFKSVLGGIGAIGGMAMQGAALRSIHRALRPGGMLLFAENLAGSPAHRYLRRSCVAWGREWRYVTIEEMRLLLKYFADVRYETTGVLAAFGRTELARNGLGLLDDLLVSRVVAEGWRYVVYGSATKQRGSARSTVPTAPIEQSHCSTIDDH